MEWMKRALVSATLLLLFTRCFVRFSSALIPDAARFSFEYVQQCNVSSMRATKKCYNATLLPFVTFSFDAPGCTNKLYIIFQLYHKKWVHFRARAQIVRMSNFSFSFFWRNVFNSKLRKCAFWLFDTISMELPKAEYFLCDFTLLFRIVKRTKTIVLKINNWLQVAFDILRFKANNLLCLTQKTRLNGVRLFPDKEKQNQHWPAWNTQATTTHTHTDSVREHF